jgi:hypothetical protein
LYHICLPDPQLVSLMPLPLCQYQSYHILNPYCTLGWWLTPCSLTIVSVCDSVSPLPLPYYRSLTQFSFCLPISVLLLTAWSVLKFLTYINPVYHSCIL